MTTTFDGTQGLDLWVEAVSKDSQGMDEAIREEVFTGELRHLQRLGPRVTGEHVSAWTPYGAEGPGVSKARAQGETAPVPLTEAARVLEGLPMDADYGNATSDPAAFKLIVVGTTDKAKPHYPRQAIRLAIRQARAAAKKRAGS